MQKAIGKETTTAKERVNPIGNSYRKGKNQSNIRNNPILQHKLDYEQIQ